MNEDIQNNLAKGTPSTVLTVGEVYFELKRISPGEFMMGSSEDEDGHKINESPSRLIQITKAFYIGQFEVTRAQYQEILGNKFTNVRERTIPISQITFKNAIDFCKILSAESKMEVNLPTEAQWEYACRASTQTRFSSGNSVADLIRVSWYAQNSEGSSHAVGQKEPNHWGLYDMHGNVWEYCVDFIEDYMTMSSIDPVGRISDRQGAMRGGGWMHDDKECRSAARLISDDMFGGAGFRIVINNM